MIIGIVASYLQLFPHSTLITHYPQTSSTHSSSQAATSQQASPNFVSNNTYLAGNINRAARYEIHICVFHHTCLVPELVPEEQDGEERDGKVRSDERRGLESVNYKI